MKVPSKPYRWLDRLGIGVSALCALHCVLLTVAVAVAPAVWLRQQLFGVGVRWLVLAEWLLAAAAIGLALASAWRGWRRHRRAAPLALLACGTGALLVGVYTRVHALPRIGTAVVVCGGLLLIAGHLWSLRLQRRAGCLR